MVSQTLASAILNQKGPDLVGSFREGQEFAKGQQVEKLTGQALQAGGGQKLQELIGLDPEVGYSLGEAIGARSAKELNNFIRDASITENFFKQGNFDQGRQFIQQSLDTVKMAGGSGKIQQNLLDIYDNQGKDAAYNQVLAVTSSLAKSKQQGQASAKTEILPNGTVIQAMPDGSVLVKNPEGQNVEGSDRVEALKASQQFTQEAERTASDLKVDTALKVATADKTVARTSEIKKELSTRNRDSKRLSVRLNRASTLINQADQGVKGELKVKLSRIFPDIDVTNEAALEQSLKELAVGQLQQFKGPTTDFEFGIVESSTGTLGDSKTANKARVNALKRAAWFNERELEQFVRFEQKNGDPDTFGFNFNEQINTKKGAFSLQDLQDTAVENNLTIEQTLQRLNQ
tara:strand:- start:4075 stop:5283 length:1209 start_codon:yes stop_codon:yes gene_type:complete